MKPTINTQFDKDEFDKAYPDGIENDFWNTARNRIIHHFIRKHKIDHILDVGCGRGITTQYLSERGKNILGVELGDCTPVSPECKIYYNTDVVNLPQDVQESTKCIALFDVIEHIESPKDFLNNTLKFFPSVTHIVFTVPARKELWSNYDEYYGHFRRYDREMAHSLVDSIGYLPIENCYFFHGLYLLLLLNGRFKKNRDIKLSAPRNMLTKYIHQMLGLSLYMETRLIPGTIYGSSVLCVAKRIT